MDPRAGRTRQHVQNSARALLEAHGPEAVTYTSVGKASRAARQTLYHHWPGREHPIAGMLFINRVYNYPPQIAMTPAEHLRAFLLNLRELSNAPAIAALRT